VREKFGIVEFIMQTDQKGLMAGLTTSTAEFNTRVMSMLAQSWRRIEPYGINRNCRVTRRSQRIVRTPSLKSLAPGQRTGTGR